MSTYRFRIRFHISSKGNITGDVKEHCFVLPNGEKAILSAIDAETLSEATKFVIISKGYKSENEAVLSGTKMKDSLLYFAVKYRVGMDLGKDKATSFLGSSVKDKIFEEHGVKLENDIHGLSIYSDEHPISHFSSSAFGIVNPRNSAFFSSEICSFYRGISNFDGKAQLAMELISASFFETSPRSRFLTLVLAAEAILEMGEKNQETQSVVSELISLVKNTTLTEPERNSIIGPLRWLKKDSISLSLKKMAATYLPNKQYDSLKSEAFIKKCYDARSKLVHEGGVDESKYNIGTLGAQLEVYMSDLLSEIVSI